jgi:IclR family transcriptional regulator, positive regulator for flagellar biogenesis
MSPRATVREDASVLLTVERGMQVLRAFRSDRVPVTNAELVRRTGLPKATVSRLTSTLLGAGFLRHVDGGREFELATGPLGIGHAYLASSQLLRAANPLLQELAERLDLSVALAMRDHLEMVYIAYRASHVVATLRLGVGSVLPLGTTAIGRAYLWGLPASEQQHLLAELERRAGERACELEQGIRASFSELDATGVCTVLGGYQRDAYGVALPITVGRQRLLMGLSCGKAGVHPDLDAERRRIAPVLKRAAADFEARLAEFDGPP